MAEELTEGAVPDNTCLPYTGPARFGPLPGSHHFHAEIPVALWQCTAMPDQGIAVMLVGYLRVSSADERQSVDLQRDALRAAGVEPEQLYHDLASGKCDDRPGLAACLKALRQGDVLVAWKLDRLGRDLRHLVNLVHELTTRGVGLKILIGKGAKIDTTTRLPASW